MVGSWFIYFHTIYIVDSYIGNYGAMARETPRLKQAVEVREKLRLACSCRVVVFLMLC